MAPFTPDTIDNMLCMARTWAGGKGGQCTKKSDEGSDFCKLHAKQNGAPAGLAHGRVDGDIPPIKLAEFEKAARVGPKEPMKRAPKEIATDETAPSNAVGKSASATKKVFTLKTFKKKTISSIAKKDITIRGKIFVNDSKARTLRKRAQANALKKKASAAELKVKIRRQAAALKLKTQPSALKARHDATRSARDKSKAQLNPIAEPTNKFAKCEVEQNQSKRGEMTAEGTTELLGRKITEAVEHTEHEIRTEVNSNLSDIAQNLLAKFDVAEDEKKEQPDDKVAVAAGMLWEPEVAQNEKQQDETDEMHGFEAAGC